MDKKFTFPIKTLLELYLRNSLTSLEIEITFPLQPIIFQIKSKSSQLNPKSKNHHHRRARGGK